MTERTADERALLIQMTIGALGGFGDAVATNKIPPEKAAHKAVVMAESAINEITGHADALLQKKSNVYIKPDR